MIQEHIELCVELTSLVNYTLQKDPQTTVLTRPGPSVTGSAGMPCTASLSKMPYAASTQAGVPLLHLPNPQEKKLGSSSLSMIFPDPLNSLCQAQVVLIF